MKRLADQKELRNYISKFGSYAGSTNKSDYLLNPVFKYNICNMAKSSLDTYCRPILYPFDEKMGYSGPFPNCSIPAMK